MNNINLIGYMGRDPELKYFDSGMAKATFSLGVSGWKQGESITTWFSCIAFGKTAEVIGEKLFKGSQVGVSGSMQNYEYEAKDGTTKKGMEVVVNKITFCGSKGNKEEF